MKRRQVLLTEAEWQALKMIVGNGWGDGDYEGWGGDNPKVQLSAMKKLDDAKLISVQLTKPYLSHEHKKVRS